MPALTQQRLEDPSRPGDWRGAAERSDQTLIAHADGVHLARSRQRQPVQHRWNSQKIIELVSTLREMMPKTTKLMEPRFPRRYVAWAVVQKHALYRGCTSCHALFGGRLGVCRSMIDEGSIKATSETEKDARQASSSAPTKVTPSATQPAGASSSSSNGPAPQASSLAAADTTTSAGADQVVASVNVGSAEQHCLMGRPCRRRTHATPLARCTGWDWPWRRGIFDVLFIRQHEKVNDERA